MPKQVGSQYRETLEEAGYEFVCYAGSRKMGERGVVLKNLDGNQELWFENDDYAGYVIEVDGIGYEFLSSAKGDWMKP